MLSIRNHRFQVWGLRIAATFLILAFLFWAGCHIFVPGLIKKSVTEYGQRLGYEIAYQDLTLSPLRLQIELNDLHLSKEGGNTLLEFKKLLVSLKWTKLVKGELGFDQILLDEPQLLVEKKLNTWNWQEFAHAIEKNLPPADPKAPSKPIKISVGKFLVSSASLALVDQSLKLKEELKPFTVELLDVANYDKEGDVSGVRGRYDLNLGALQLLIPGINKTIGFHHISLGGGLDNPSPNNLGVQLDLKLDDGQILSHWDLNTISKEISGKLKLENIATAPFIALLPANKELLGSSGVMNADIGVTLGGDSDRIAGDLHLSNLAVIEKGEKTPLITWDAADVRQFEYKSSKQANDHSNSSLTIDELIIDHPSLRFDINDQGMSNFRRLFSKPAADAASPENAPLVNKTASPEFKNTFGLDIKTLGMKNGEVFFTDLAMRPNFKVDIKKFNATLIGVSNAPGHFATVAMDGVVANSGSMRAKGQASFDDPRRNHDILMTFRNLPLTTFNPAVMTYAGYQISGGHLSLNLNYRAKDGQLTGSNQIIIKGVQLGDEVPDYQGKKLPLGLAIALLEDSDDTIDVTIRIAGNVDSPEFSASGLVWQAISNVLSNVATAPFRALGSIMGMGGENGINAVLGEAVFLPADQDRLEKFGEYLDKHPNSKLELIGTYDPVQDKQELARVKADTAILKDAGFKLEPGEPIPAPSLTDPRIQSGLRTAYAQYVGRIKLGQRLLMLPEGEARNDQLHTELIAAIEISEEELRQLAKNRAQLAFSLMTTENPGLKDRINFGDIKTVEAGKEGVPLDVELRIK
jgi:hypothetical protein